MAKKIVSFCMAFALMAVCTLVSSCDKEEAIETSVGVQAVNIEGLPIQDKTVDLMKAAFVKAVNDANGTEASQMANAVKVNLKAALVSTIPASELEILRGSKELYFHIVVVKRSDPTTVLSETKLYGSEL